MLEGLTKRLNNDENKAMEMKIMEEASINSDNAILDKLVSNYSDEELNSFIEAINLIPTDNDIPVEMNAKNYSVAFTDTNKVITETVVSTNKCISISKDDYLSLLRKLKKFDTLDDENKKETIKKAKSFLRSVNKELRKCNDDHPADAMVIALVNKLCKIYNVDIDLDEENTAKYRLAAKVNSLAKVIK